MQYRSCFDIIGPIMVGPSSSHTAGAVLIGQFAYHLLGAIPEQVEITLYDSFAETYQGHGTDKAIIGGLLGLGTDDHRIKEAIQLAHWQQMTFNFHLEERCPHYEHPNTAVIRAKRAGRSVNVGGASLGGGIANIFLLNNLKVDIRLSTEDHIPFLCQPFKTESHSPCLSSEGG